MKSLYNIGDKIHRLLSKEKQFAPLQVEEIVLIIFVNVNVEMK